MSWANEQSQKEAQRLLRIVAAPEFQFVVVHHNAYPVIDEIEKLLRESYPDRPCSRVRLGQVGFKGLVEHYKDQKSGFVLVEDWWRTAEDIDMGAGINGARERFSRLPVGLIVFMRDHKETVRGVMKVMPDLWSIRTTVMRLEVDLEEVEKAKSLKQNREIEKAFQDGRVLITEIGNLERSRKSLENAKRALAENPPASENLNLRISYLHSILHTSKAFPELWDEGLHYGKMALEELQEFNATEDALADFHEKVGDIFLAKRELDEAITHFEKAVQNFGNNPFSKVEVSIKQAVILGLQGEFSSGLERLQSMEEEVRNLGFPELMFRWSFSKASILTMAEELPAAREGLKEALQQADLLKNPSWAAETFEMKGITYQKEGNYLEAGSAFQIAYDMFKAGSAPVQRLADALDLAYMSQFRSEQYEEALASLEELLALKEEHPEVTISLKQIYEGIGVVNLMLKNEERGHHYLTLAQNLAPSDSD